MYGAVPPPPQLQDGVHIPSTNVPKLHDTESFCATVTVGFGNVVSQATLSPSIRPLNPGIPVANTSCHPFTLANSTSYSGYGGIYPQATPLQQLALSLKQSSSSENAVITPTTTASTEDLPEKTAKPIVEKQQKRRKFQELPAAPRIPEIWNQVMHCLLTNG